MKTRTPFIPSLVIVFLALFSCEEKLDLTPGHYVGRYTLKFDSTEIQVNNRSSVPFGNTGVVLKWENQESTDTIAHYEILGDVYHIYDWDILTNGSYLITYKDKDSFHLRREDGKEIFFNKRIE